MSGRRLSLHAHDRDTLTPAARALSRYSGRGASSSASDKIRVSACGLLPVLGEKVAARRMRGILVILGLTLLPVAPSLADDPANQLTLADLAAYRLALSGKATAPDARSADPPIAVGFRDLWDRSDALKGRRVSVKGRVERIFRQGPVGQFPALVQAWAFSRSGDPFCLVYPDPAGKSPGSDGGAPGPPLGEDIQFTGTFLKVVEYPATDGPRLAPMIVGDKPVAPARPEPSTRRPSEDGPEVSKGSWLAADWLFGLLAVLAVSGVIAARHLRPLKPTKRSVETDPPLEFIASRPGSDSGGPHAAN